ncbi:MAG: histidinol-phosphatase [Actinomycetota bacterium]|nr:histidinol-phosphatase [Actinomycetota bacterium]
MLDYHLHLWPHTQHDAPLALEQVASYCERAQDAGVVEIALTEHLFRFVQADRLLAGFWDDVDAPEPLRRSMAEYWRFHVAADLDEYVSTVLEAKRQGLPVVLGLEVDYYRGRMDEVAALLAGYPFDVLLGSVHWIGDWRFDDLDDPVSMAEWSAREVDDCWDAYADAFAELAATRTCDVFAHPDLVKVTGRVPERPQEWWDRLADAAASSGMAAEVSSAGWRKPVAEQYPALGLLVRLAARGVPFTTASDAHHLSHVADRVGDLHALLRSAGIDRLTAYRRRQPHTLPLAERPHTLPLAEPPHALPLSERPHTLPISEPTSSGTAASDGSS